MPSLSGTNSPLAVVILKRAPGRGCLVTLSYFSTIRLPFLVLVIMTVCVSPLGPMTTLVEGLSITYPPSGALTSEITYAPGARLDSLISPWESVVKMPFCVRVAVPITPSNPTSHPAAVVTRNSAPGKTWLVWLSRFWMISLPRG